MNVFIVNQDNPAANGLIKKLSAMGDGSILCLTNEEMELYNSEDFKHIYNGGGSPLIEIDRDKQYIMVCDPETTNFEDIDNINLSTFARIAVIRCRE